MGPRSRCRLHLVCREPRFCYSGGPWCEGSVSQHSRAHLAEGRDMMDGWLFVLVVVLCFGWREIGHPRAEKVAPLRTAGASGRTAEELALTVE